MNQLKKHFKMHLLKRIVALPFYQYGMVFFYVLFDAPADLAGLAAFFLIQEAAFCVVMKKKTL